MILGAMGAGAGSDYAELEVVGGVLSRFLEESGGSWEERESALLEKPHRGGISQPDASGPGPNSLMGFRHKPAPETQFQKKKRRYFRSRTFLLKF